MLYQQDLRQKKSLVSEAVSLTDQERDSNRPKDADDGYVRETFVLPPAQARERVSSWLATYHPAMYWSRVENWQELHDGMIRFTMVRLPSAD